MLIFNMGLPMIFPAMYLMTAALLPIVFLEGYFISVRLGIDLWKTLRSVALANIVSTVFGIPATWCILFALQIMTGGTSAFNVAPFWEKFCW